MNVGMLGLTLGGGGVVEVVGWLSRMCWRGGGRQTCWGLQGWLSGCVWEGGKKSQGWG